MTRHIFETWMFSTDCNNLQIIEVDLLHLKKKKSKVKIFLAKI